MSGRAEPPASEKSKLFLRLFLQNERRLYAYILTLLPNRADADDVLQEASLVMWDKFDADRPPESTAERPTCAAVDSVVAPSANRRARRSRSAGRSFSRQPSRASRRASSCSVAACSTAVSAMRSSIGWLNTTRLRSAFL